MATIGQVDIVDGLPELEIPEQKSTIRNFKNNEEVFEWFQNLKILAKKWDNAVSNVDLVQELKK